MARSPELDSADRPCTPSVSSAPIRQDLSAGAVHCGHRLLGRREAADVDTGRGAVAVPPVPRSFSTAACHCEPYVADLLTITAAESHNVTVDDP
jgi:hypothetical protein